MLNRETRAVLHPFLLRDGTATLRVWCDSASVGPRLAKGAHVRVTGRFVDTDYKLHFVAEHVDGI